MSKYETIIGLEIHVQLKTKSKMFCSCSNNQEAEPNSNICPVCMGHPGTLPHANKQAIDWTIMTGLSLGCKIGTDKKDSEEVVSKFDRKNYFYPDLPKGYQISQLDKPFCNGGELEIKVGDSIRKVELERIHLEEDAGKLMHSGVGESLVDYNRGGVPLMEIVTKPCFENPEEAKIFLQELRKLLKYLNVSDADMEKGQMRCDANISLREKGDRKLNPKTEIKNMNSFKAVADALAYEEKRQEELWNENNPPSIESTRGWVDAQRETAEMRTKEGAADYRYFPEPDLPYFEFSKNYIAELKEDLPELPNQKQKRFAEEFRLSDKEIKVLISNIKISEFFENSLSEAREWYTSREEKHNMLDKEYYKLAKLISGWFSSKLLALLNESGQNIVDCKVTPENFAELISLLYTKKIGSKVAQDVLKIMFEKGSDPSQVVEEQGLSQVSDEGELDQIIEKVIAENEKPVEDYRSGNKNAIQALIGKVMAETKGKADPGVAAKILGEKLSE
ncbi:MAG: Asp-tRNA(Asn)/Glu-tRNA(Gln) amidotransferase subunit GatB [Parcubacteria group bacterium]|nr:Asp-tRNA(Asn)/Glu-tRNA(Gln) amidotransferase subunit GatB [Parcubacteria group bacterium]